MLLLLPFFAIVVIVVFAVTVVVLVDVVVAVVVAAVVAVDMVSFRQFLFPLSVLSNGRFLLFFM